MVALVDGVPRTLNLVTALAGLSSRTRSTSSPAARSTASTRPAGASTSSEGRFEALDVIDRDHRPHPGQRRSPPRPGGLMAEPYEFTELQAKHILEMRLGAADPAQPDRPSSSEIVDAAASIVELEAILADARRARRGHHAPRCQRSRKSSPRPRGCEIGLDDGEMTDLDLVEDKELVIVMTEAQYVKAVTADSVQDAGSRRSRRQRRQAEDRRHRAATSSSRRPTRFLLFFSNRGRVYRLRAHGHPRARAHGQGHADRQPAAAAGRRDDPGHHRHPRLRRRAQPVLRHAQGRRQEDRRSTSTTSAGATASSRSTSRDGDELVRVIETTGSDDIFMVSRSGHDHPLQRGRGAAPWAEPRPACGA